MEFLAGTVFNELHEAREGRDELDVSKSLLKRIDTLHLGDGKPFSKLKGNEYAVTVRRDFGAMKGYYLDIERDGFIPRLTFLRVREGELRTFFPVSYDQALGIADQYLPELPKKR